MFSWSQLDTNRSGILLWIVTPSPIVCGEVMRYSVQAAFVPFLSNTNMIGPMPDLISIHKVFLLVLNDIMCSTDIYHFVDNI